MKLTHELFEAGRSERGGHSLNQLKALGLPMPARGWPNAGWPKLLIGKEVTEAQYAEFMALKGAHCKGKKSAPETGNDLLRNVPQTPDANVESVREKLKVRAVIGLHKYGVTTERTDLSRKQWLIHAQEEALDFAVYLERLIQEEEDAQIPKSFRDGMREAEAGQLLPFPDESPEDFANEMFRANNGKLD